MVVDPVQRADRLRWQPVDDHLDLIVLERLRLECEHMLSLSLNTGRGDLTPDEILPATTVVRAARRDRVDATLPTLLALLGPPRGG